MAPETAQQIAQTMLAVTGNATMSKDFDTYARCFHLPQTMETYSGRVDINTVKDLREIFDSVCKQFDAMGVTDFVRRCLEAQFRDPATIVVAHETRLMRDNYLLREPYPSYGTLKYIDDRWQITDSMYAIKDINSIYNILTGKY